MKLLKDSSLPELNDRSVERQRGEIQSDNVSILSKFQSKVSNYNYKNQVSESEAPSHNELNLHKTRKLEY